MNSFIDTKTIILCVVLLISWGFWGRSHYKDKAAHVELQARLAEYEAKVAGYRALYDHANEEYHQHKDLIDSLDQVRYENDTTHYRIPADSLERIFSDRFGNHKYDSSQQHIP